jgi:amidophosphoribosyltransferase
LFTPELKEECGIFAVTNNKKACFYTALGLYSLQHRGQEAAGIATYGLDGFQRKRAEGVVGEIFKFGDKEAQLTGEKAIGHVRYSTAGGGGQENIQPLWADTDFGRIAIAHNGNLTNAQTLKNELIKEGRYFQSTSDTEVILHLIAKRIGEMDIPTRIISALKEISGAYSLVFMTKDKIMAVRGPFGMRPLVMGKKGGSYIFSSESCAFNLIDAEYIRDVNPGEMIVIEDGREPYSINMALDKPERFCIFEYIYYMRPDSCFKGKNVSMLRQKIGEELAKKFDKAADVVIPVPDSGIPMALGFSRITGIPYQMGILRGHYIGRTFISPTDEARNLKTKLKLSIDENIVRGKKVVLVDDSIVRGVTMKNLVQMVRRAGAKEVHVLSGCPPIKHPCFYGIDMPTHKELLSASMNENQIAGVIGADSVAFITINGLYRALGNNEVRPDYQNRCCCDACLTDDYDVPVIDEELKQEMDK